MSPAVAHFKNRIMPSATGSSIEEMPPAKRGRETVSTSPVMTHADPRATSDPRATCTTLGKTPLINEKRLARTGNSVPVETSSNGPAAPAVAEPSSKAILPTFYTVADTKALECPICFHPLSTLPIYQCKNGHFTCPSCKSNMEKKNKGCHCGEATWDVRCYALEAVLLTLSVRCNNAVYGCNDFPEYLKKREHEEELCRHRPFDCPIEGCTYKGPMPALLQHFDKKHNMQAVQIEKESLKAIFTIDCKESYKLVQYDQELYFLYHESVVGYGDVFYLATFGPHKRSHQLRVELRSERRFHAIWSLTPDIKELLEWKRRRDYLSILEGVQAEPRTDCYYDVELFFIELVRR